MGTRMKIRMKEMSFENKVRTLYVLIGFFVGVASTLLAVAIDGPLDGFGVAVVSAGCIGILVAAASILKNDYQHRITQIHEQ